VLVIDVTGYIVTCISVWLFMAPVARYVGGVCVLCVSVGWVFLDCVVYSVWEFMF